MIRLAITLLTCALGAADVAVSAPWSRATVAGQQAGAVFAVITGGDADDRLLGGECAAAATLEVHEHAAGADGVMQMRQVAGGLAVPAHATVALKPRSYHIMLIGLRAALVKGTKVPVTLVFERAGKVQVEAEVLDPWAMAADDR